MGSRQTAIGQACGKAILIGEHFVVFGGTAIAFPVLAARLQVTLKASERARNRVWLEADHEDSRRLLEACRRGLKEITGGRRYRLD